MAKKETTFQMRKRRNRYNLKKRSTNPLRLSVHRSNTQIYAQIIDDAAGKTLASASSLDKELKKNISSGGNIKAAQAVGALIAARAKALKLKQVTFDRGGYIYHGRVKALADAARENGMVF